MSETQEKKRRAKKTLPVGAPRKEGAEYFRWYRGGVFEKPRVQEIMTMHGTSGLAVYLYVLDQSLYEDDIEVSFVERSETTFYKSMSNILHIKVSKCRKIIEDCVKIKLLSASEMTRNLSSNDLKYQLEVVKSYRKQEVGESPTDETTTDKVGNSLTIVTKSNCSNVSNYSNIVTNSNNSNDSKNEFCESQKKSFEEIFLSSKNLKIKDAMNYLSGFGIDKNLIVDFIKLAGLTMNSPDDLEEFMKTVKKEVIDGAGSFEGHFTKRIKEYLQGGE